MISGMTTPPPPIPLHRRPARTARAALLLVLAATAFASGAIDGDSPSRSLYFDWINSQYEGTTDAHTRLNMAVFQWLPR